MISNVRLTRLRFEEVIRIINQEIVVCNMRLQKPTPTLGELFQWLDQNPGMGFDFAQNRYAVHLEEILNRYENLFKRRARVTALKEKFIESTR